MDIHEQIAEIKRREGKNLLVLGHHYQDPEVLRHADVVGDSLELSRNAAAAHAARRIVFCGVHFMAESAAILGCPGQAVYMPDVAAGCPMAEMADLTEAEQAWRDVTAAGGEWAPVVYVNSTARIKAFCGGHGGSTCTSSNAAKVFAWALKSGRRILFLPDEHLGLNTADDLALASETVMVYDPRKPNGGLTAEQLRAARLVVWKGYCHVHTNFTMAHVEQARLKWPDAKIIVHPETPRRVVQCVDAHGSTAQIIAYVRKAPAGSTIVVGTETNLVRRLATEEQGRVTVIPLAHSICPNMARTTPAKLAALLRDWPAANMVQVPPGIAGEARLALDRMLEL